MDGYIDQGKIPVAGYLNADPPGQAQFALTAAGSDFASSIQRAGGEVTVDSFGGINMAANSGSFVGIDSFANVTVSAVDAGTVLIESAGLGADVDIVNAGSIVFDALGQGILLNVQTINGTVYPPPGSGATTSITQGGGIVACLGNGAINISSVGAGVDVNVSNAGTITFDTAGSRAIVNLSTINGVAYPPSTTIPSDLTVSTLTASSYVSTLGLEGVSSINGVAWPLTSIGDIANTYVLTDGTSVTIGGSGSAPAIEVGSDNTVYLGDGTATVNISNLSTINGSAYPLAVSTIGNTANTFVTANGTYVQLGYALPALEVASDNSITVGSTTANTKIVYASTIQASASGLIIVEPTGGSSVLLDIAGKVFVNSGVSTITDGTGLVFGTEGTSLTFPLEVTTLSTIGEIFNLSSINGAVYPPAGSAPKQASYYKSVAQNMTSGNNDITFDLSGAWNNAGGYITHTDGTTDFTVVQTGVYQLECNLSVLTNSAIYTTTSNKTVAIDITRSPTAEVAIISVSGLQATAQNYQMAVSGSYALVAGDVINIRAFNSFTAATPQIQGVTTTFDLNTFFTWRFIS